MLAKLGWKKGKGLGKDNEGIVNPINPNVSVNRKGLGFQ